MIYKFNTTESHRYRSRMSNLLLASSKNLCRMKFVVKTSVVMLSMLHMYNCLGLNSVTNLLIANCTTGKFPNYTNNCQELILLNKLLYKQIQIGKKLVYT